MTAQSLDQIIYANLRKKYLIVFLLGTFADWLQGPYIYRLYADYGYGSEDISLLYVTGFASSTMFGVVVGYLADKFGRKKLCIAYSILYSMSCVMKIFNNFQILMLGRVLGGVSTSILFSTFESWYVCQHLTKYHLEKELINVTMSKSTFYNGLLAIIAGFVSSAFADEFNMGPLAPFLLAVPVLLVSGFFCSILWEENLIPKKNETQKLKYVSSLGIMFHKNNRILLYLGLVQSLVESVMYVFVFLWTPVLAPIRPSHGVIFSSFMVCIMIGSYLYSYLHATIHIQCEHLLGISILISLSSISICSYGSYIQTNKSSEIYGTYLCLFAFLIFEVAIGIYYPAIGYFRGIIIPESHRTSIINWFRLPMNLFTCSILLYVKINVPQNYHIFSISAVSLVIAALSCSRFIRSLNGDGKPYANTVNLVCSEVLLL